ncbi:unnamed protein product [Absidia cylindrospora]
MISILKSVHSSLNTSAPTLTSPSNEPPTNTDDLTMKRKQQFASRTKNDIQLWERILRYENVDIKTCSEGLSSKEKSAYHEYLDENVRETIQDRMNCFFLFSPPLTFIFIIAICQI